MQASPESNRDRAELFVRRLRDPRAAASAFWTLRGNVWSMSHLRGIVIPRSDATRRSRGAPQSFILDRFAALAMTTLVPNGYPLRCP
jgi:hypothetical protein